MAYPDVLALVRGYLATACDPTPVLTQVPSPRPVTFVQIRHVGGAELRPVRDRARLDVFTWDATEAQAQTLGLQVREFMHDLAGTSTLGIMCYRVDEFLSPRPFEDLLSGSPRTWATYSLDVRADAAIAH